MLPPQGWKGPSLLTTSLVTSPLAVVPWMCIRHLHPTVPSRTPCLLPATFPVPSPGEGSFEVVLAVSAVTLASSCPRAASSCFHLCVISCTHSLTHTDLTFVTSSWILALIF